MLRLVEPDPESALRIVQRALHDRKNEAEALMHIGTTCGSLGDIKRTQESWRHALALFRMLEDPRAAQIRAWLHTLDERLGAN